MGVLLAAVLLFLGLYLSVALLIDVRAGLAQARTISVYLAMNVVWAAFGAVVAAWVLPENRRQWRLGLLLLVLAGTGYLLFLQSGAFTGDVVPKAADIVVPSLIGALAMSVVAARRTIPIQLLDSQSHVLSVRLWPAVVVSLLLASPMIVSPVVENWNASGWMDSHSYDAYAHNILSGKAPAGHSNYMPVYQYGLAAVYYLSGHFFFAQQLVNIALAFVTIVLLCLSAWNLFRNVWAVLLIGIWIGYLRQFVYAVHFTQIESWYLPIIAFTIFAWTCYWRTPSRVHLVMLAVGSGIAINTRNQGAFYFAWLCLAPLFLGILPWRRRLSHIVLAIAIVGVSLVPWSLRNYAVDGRLSPSAARNAYYLAILNDPRIGLYGVRYWDGWATIGAEYIQKYPDVVERDRVMMRDGLTAPFRNPSWFARAMFWRTGAFYGLLPDSIFGAEGPRAPNWAVEWRGFVYWKITPLLLLPLSLLGLVLRPGRPTIYLAVAVLANVATVAMAGGSEDRVSYPVLPMHMLMALAAVFAPQPHEPRWNVLRSIFRTARPRTWMVAAIGALVFLTVARIHFGRANLYAPQSERHVFLKPNLEIDPTLPSLNEYASRTVPPAEIGPEWAGKTVRVRLILFNYQCPPKYGGAIGYMPAFTTDPNGETFYYASLPPSGPGQKPVTISVGWFGAAVNEPLREGDEVEAEARVLLAPSNIVATYWLDIDKARKVPARSSEVPAFF